MPSNTSMIFTTSQSNTQTQSQTQGQAVSLMGFNTNNRGINLLNIIKATSQNKSSGCRSCGGR